MHELFADGGLIRKLWIGEAARYRDHLLRLEHRAAIAGLAPACQMISSATM